MCVEGALGFVGWACVVVRRPATPCALRRARKALAKHTRSSPGPQPPPKHAAHKEKQHKSRQHQSHKKIHSLAEGQLLEQIDDPAKAHRRLRAARPQPRRLHVDGALHAVGCFCVVLFEGVVDGGGGGVGLGCVVLFGGVVCVAVCCFGGVVCVGAFVLRRQAMAGGGGA